MIPNDPRARAQDQHAEARFGLDDVDDFDGSAWPGAQTCLIVDDYRSLRGDRYRGTTLASTSPEAPAPRAELAAGRSSLAATRVR